MQDPYSQAEIQQNRQKFAWLKNSIVQKLYALVDSELLVVLAGLLLGYAYSLALDKSADIGPLANFPRSALYGGIVAVTWIFFVFCIWSFLCAKDKESGLWDELVHDFEIDDFVKKCAFYEELDGYRKIIASQNRLPVYKEYQYISEQKWKLDCSVRNTGKEIKKNNIKNEFFTPHHNAHN